MDYIRSRSTLIFILLILFVGKTYADDKHTVYGRVADSFSREPLAYVNVVVMRPDSSFVLGVSSMDNQHSEEGAQFKFIMEKEGEYILRLTYVGYEPTYKNIHIKYYRRMLTFNMGTVFMRKAVTALNEVAVNATKIKMIMKKDTIVYNADAFKLSQGSMLDQLIRQLPGAELKANGQIYINGKYVNNLLVNGEDFFKGDPKIALDNLPAYMVDKVKVYEKQSAESEALGIKDVNKKPLVIDVNLKRQYNVGWIANADVGYGTSDRYAAKVFGLRFSDCSRLALFGNLNNTNDTRQPGINGEWTQQWTPSGLVDLQSGGMELLINDRKKRYKITSNVKVEHTETDNQVETSGTTFLSGGDVFTRSRNLTKNRSTKMSTDHYFELKPKWAFITFAPHLDYSTYNYRLLGQEGTFTSNPMEKYRGEALDSLFSYDGGSALKKLAINRRLQDYLGKGNILNMSTSFRGSGRVSKTSYDVLGFYGNADYTHLVNRAFNKNSLCYYDKGNVVETDFRNQYFDFPQSSYNYKIGSYYTASINNIAVATHYLYTQNYRSSDRSLYRLDNYKNWGIDSSHPLGMLPSTQDSLQQTIDARNSFYSTQHDKVHLVKFDIHYQRNVNTATGTGSLQLNIKLPTRFERNRLNYQRAQIDTSLVRRVTFFEPDVSIRLVTNDWHTFYDLNYSLSGTSPDMTYLLDTRDDANSLSIRLGNPNLSNAQTHHARFSVQTGNTEKQQTMSFNLDYNLLLNAICQSMTYDKKTGANIYRPENINGNWNVSGGFNFSQAVDKNKRFTLSSNTNAGYNNSVDNVSVYGESESRRSSVRNWNIGETLRGDYRLNNYFIGVKAGLNLTHATSDRTDFIDINCADINYGLNGQVPLPLDMELSTDITMYSRRGYTDSNMNTNELVWNARLAKRLMNGNLTLIIDGFDLLGNLSNVRQTLNAQGRKEVFYNVIPQYTMLHVVYRLNKEPRKKK